jgi:hypothetical protein
MFITVKSMKKIIYLTLILSFAAASCDDNEEKKIVGKGTRNLGIHVTEAKSLDFDKSFQIAKQAGMDCIPQVFFWTDIEGATGYDPNNLFDIMNLYYPQNKMAVSLCISPIAAVNRSMPEELKSLSFSDPVLIARFKQLLNELRATTPDVALRYLLIGNEVDLYFATHADEWDNYKVFVSEVRQHAKSLWGNNLLVGAEVTLEGASGKDKQYIEQLNSVTDMVCFTYYPLNADFTMKPVSEVKTDLNKILDIYPTQKLFLEECGYATSSVTESSEEEQAEFISTMFDLWDKHSEQLVYVGFLWLHDLSEQKAELYVDEYGMTAHLHAAKFKEYLRTTGMRTYDGVDKKGFLELKKQATARGWGL